MVPHHHFGSRLAIRPRNLPSSSSRLRRGYDRAPRGAVNFCRFRTCGQVPCLRRLEDPLPQPPYVVLVVPPVDGVPVEQSSSGPFTTSDARRPRVGLTRRGVQLALRFRRLDQLSPSQAHLPTSAPFRVRAPGPVSGQLCEHDHWRRSQSSVRGFLLPFGHRHSLLGHPAPAAEFRLPHGRPTDGRSVAPDLNGVSMFRTMTRYDRVGCPPIPRGRRCSPGRHRAFRPPPAASQRPGPSPR